MFLRASEWILAGSFVLILLSLFAIAKIQAWQYGQGSECALVPIATVKIEGCVQRPGTYEFPVGTPLKEILHKARPDRFANLRSIDPEAVLIGALELTIPKLECLKISVTGAVAKNETIEVLPGTKLCQLKPKIALIEDTDLTFFKKRRLLVDGEVIEVPYGNDKRHNKGQKVDEN
jgi:hypothetical protein